MFLIIFFGLVLIAFRILLSHPNSSPFWQTGWWQYGSFVWLIIGLQFGDLVTLIKPADRLFFLGNDRDMVRHYLPEALRFSYVLAVVWQLGFVLAISPILVRIGIDNPIIVSAMIAFLCSYKLVLLMQVREKLFLRPRSDFTVVIFERGTLPEAMLYHFLYPAVGLGLVMFMPTTISVIFTACWLALLGLIWLWHHRTSRLKWDSYAMNWEATIQHANRHNRRLERFYALFAETPRQERLVRRRAYLDPLLHWFVDGRPVNYRLFITRFFRSDTILPIVFRLCLLADLILINLSKSSIIISATVAAVVVFLVDFQILPLFADTRQNLWTRILPIGINRQRSDFTQIMLNINLTVTLVMLLANIFMPVHLIATAIGGLLMIAFMRLFYIPRYLNKIQ